MSNSVDAIVQPNLLKWGRESIGYELEAAAKKVGVTAQTLAEWEIGNTRPTVIQLMRIANVYKRPFAVFYLTRPPNEMDEPFDALRDWRKLPTTQNYKKSVGLVMELREALNRRSILLDLADEMREEAPEFGIQYRSKETASDLAKRVRSKLAITYETQSKLRQASDALKMWRTAVESLDVLVFQTGFFSSYPVQVEEMRGIAIFYEQLPIIIINSKDSDTARIFTMMHELGHLILRLSGISNTYEYDGISTEEIFCNEFAAEILVPANLLKQEPLVKKHTGLTWDDEVLRQLATRFHVSREVVLRRLLSLQLTTEGFYQEKREQWQEEWIAFNRAKDKNKGGPLYHTKFVRCHGTRFVETTFDAYNRGVISANQLSDYLGAKIKHMPAILEHLHTSL